jgi:hypothetical protein
MAPKGKGGMPKKASPKKTRPTPRKPTPFLKEIGAPISYGSVQSSARSVPVGRIDPGRCIVKNFELSTAYGTSNGSFKVDGFLLNPGISTNFPWLNTVARNYQKFRFHSLRFFYSSSVSTATPGKAFITLSYDAQDGPPTTLAEAMASKTSCTGPAWFGGAITEYKAFDPMMNADANIYVDVDVAKFNSPWYYVRNSLAGLQPVVAGTGGLGTYTDESAIPLRVYYGTNGVTNGIVAGELYVAYVIEFSEPIAPADSV